MAPQYSGGDLLIHYGLSVISRVNDIFVPVKTGAAGGFRIDARRATDGSLLWSAASDYSLPAHNFSVLEAGFPSNHSPQARGWLLHFDGSLATAKIPNGFGWDDIASAVPASAISSYAGTYDYLLLTKYNDYAGAGVDGVIRMAIIDPNAGMTDPINGTTVMKTILTIAGRTPDPEYGGAAVREWCINTAAIDPLTHCAIVNSEDCKVYRWDFDSNTVSPGVTLAPPTGEAYTPTLIGPDEAIYAINKAVLSSVGAN